jgi:two-component system chemotaxis response regulator CheB
MATNRGFSNWADLSPFTCPECHGVLLSLKDGNLTRFRCHTGHAFSADRLLTTVSETVEDSIWNAVRVMEENVMLLRHLGAHVAETGQMELAESYFEKAADADMRVNLLRQVAMSHEKLNAEKLRQQAAAE